MTMNIFVNPIKISTLFFCLIALISCRKEIEEFSETKDEEALVFDSELSILLLKTTLNDGSRDNILDDSSCFSVALPVTIFLNDIKMSINSEEEFSLIAFAFDEFDDDVDRIEFIFPITIITSDFEEITISSADQLENYKENCEVIDPDADDDDIECADFLYPIAASVFDASDELLKVITLDNDKALFQFIKRLNTYDRASLVFPITIKLYDDSEIVINDIEALEEMLKSVIDECDENDLDTENFISILINSTWSIQKFKEDESNESKEFDAYTFDFKEDKTIVATVESEEIIGNWAITTGADGYLYLNINFGDETTLNKLNKKWILKSAKDKMIKLENLIDNEKSKDELFFR